MKTQVLNNLLSYFQFEKILIVKYYLLFYSENILADKNNELVFASPGYATR